MQIPDSESPFKNASKEGTDTTLRPLLPNVAKIGKLALKPV